MLTIPPSVSEKEEENIANNLVSSYKLINDILKIGSLKLSVNEIHIIMFSLLEILKYCPLELTRLISQELVAENPELFIKPKELN